MNSTNLFLDESDLRRRRSAKWSRYGAEILPAFVAEMDFQVAPAVRIAIEQVVRDQDYGYFNRVAGLPHALATAFAQRMDTLYGWQPAAELARPVADLVQGLYASVLTFSDPGQGVVMPSPIYPPIRKAILETGRRIVTLPVRDEGSGYGFDFAALDATLDRDTHLMVLCNPHNPSGRVMSRAELGRVARLAIERNLIVVADEIHADLVFDGARHIPFGSLGPEIAARTVTLASATKSFNIPGLRTGVMHLGSAALRARLDARLPERVLGAVSSIGIAATIAAWQEGDAWLANLLTHLAAARDTVMGVLGAELPEIGVHSPQGTYLAWLDCRRLTFPTTAFDYFHDRAGIALSPGENFEPGAGHFVRLNFATSMPILDKILTRLVEAGKQAVSR